MGTPFGYIKESGTYVSIDEVESGLACGCTCPSCGMKLQARLGDERAHHFSHHEKASKECEYSFWVSVRSMAKQILLEASYINIDFKQFSNLHQIPFNSILSTNKILKVIQNKNNYSFMLKLESLKELIEIHFITPEYDLNTGYEESSNNHFISKLVLEINLIDMDKNEYLSAKKHLQELILDRLDTKEWINCLNTIDYENQINKNYIDEVTSVSDMKYFYVPEEDFKEIAKQMYLDYRSLNPIQTYIIKRMKIFYLNSVNNLNQKKLLDEYSIVAEEDKFQLISYKKDLIAIANVDSVYVIYIYHYDKFIKIGSNRHYKRIQDLIINYTLEKENLF